MLSISALTMILIIRKLLTVETKLELFNFNNSKLIM